MEINSVLIFGIFQISDSYQNHKYHPQNSVKFFTILKTCCLVLSKTKFHICTSKFVIHL